LNHKGHKEHEGRQKKRDQDGPLTVARITLLSSFVFFVSFVVNQYF